METPTKTIVFLVAQTSGGGYLARALREAIITKAEGLDALRPSLCDALRRHFERDAAPRRIALRFVSEDDVVPVM